MVDQEGAACESCFQKTCDTPSGVSLILSVRSKTIEGAGSTGSSVFLCEFLDEPIINYLMMGHSYGTPTGLEEYPLTLPLGFLSPESLIWPEGANVPALLELSDSVSPISSQKVYSSLMLIVYRLV